MSSSSIPAYDRSASLSERAAGVNDGRGEPDARV